MVINLGGFAMQLNHIKDHQLLTNTKDLVKKERKLLTDILHHLREIERRRLYCDLGYQSLFEYAVKELHYSEGQAGRRIQAMRLIKEIPQVEKSIASGELSLSNVSQAQSLFRARAKETPQKPMSKKEKNLVLNCLKNKSTREGQKELLKLQPKTPDPQSFERERQITEDASEVKFLMNSKLKDRLEEVRSLLGPTAARWGYAELFDAMAELSVEKLSEKKFGKRRVSAEKKDQTEKESDEVAREQQSTPAPELETSCAPRPSKNQRYIPKALQHAVWRRDQGRCSQCGSRRNLQLDHIRPVGFGGESTAENLRLLCFHCNQRQGIKAFGAGKIERKIGVSRYKVPDRTV